MATLSEDSIYNLVELMEECVNLLEHEFFLYVPAGTTPLVNQHSKVPQEHDKLLQLELRRLLQRSLKPTKEKRICGQVVSSQ